MLIDLKKYLNKPLHRRILVWVIFLLLSILSVIYLWHFHTVYYNTDYLYHLSRIHSIDNNLVRGRLPLISWGVNVPYGTALSYYPWLTIFPLALLGLSIHNAVNLFYLMIALIYLLMYLISYCSYRTYEHSLPHDLVFAILYTSSSIVYDWAIRSGDLGVLLAMAFLPMAWFGFLAMLQHHQHWLMMTIGIILVAMSHLITAGLLIIVMLILSLINLNKFHLKDIGKFMLGIIIFLAITSLFWLPDLRFGSGIVTPYTAKPTNMYTGILVWSGVFYNYLYGLVDLVGLVSIINFKHKSFHRLDTEIWAVGLLMLLTNIPLISRLLIHYFPLVLHLQFFYRISVITHLLWTFLAVKWLTGQYTPQFKTHFRTPLYFLMLAALCTPMVNQIGTHFLLHQRPIITARNASQLMNQGDASAKFNQHSYKSLKHSYINYDYAPSKKVTHNQVFDMKKQAQIYKGSKWIGTKKYLPTDQGITIRGPERHNVQLPMMLYRPLHYQFTLNGQPLSKDLINQDLTHQTHELVLKHLPSGYNRIDLRSVTFRHW